MPHQRTRRSGAVRRDNEQPIKLSSNAASWDTVYGKSEGLKPLRETGLSLRTRKAVRQEKRNLARRRMAIASLAFLVIVAATLFFWMDNSNRLVGKQLAQNADASMNSGEFFSGIAAGTRSMSNPSTPIISSAVSIEEPTPIIASFNGLDIRLPISVNDLTEVGFHPANHSYAQSFEPRLTLADTDQVKKQKGTGRDKAQQPTDKNAILVGQSFIMYRSGRSGSSTSAIDAGAAHGSVVYSPVNGVVTQICTYTLEGKVKDYEIHIQPEGIDNYEVMVIHIEDLHVEVGDALIAGVSPIARVRNTAQFFKSQLADFSNSDGNHVHIQINDITNPKCQAMHDNRSTPLPVKEQEQDSNH